MSSSLQSGEHWIDAESDRSPDGPSHPPKRRRRAWLPASIDEIAHGASAEQLDRPAAEFMADIHWEGPPPDPDKLDAATFLSFF